MRAGKVHIAPGFDGEYGKVRIFEAVARELKGQTFSFDGVRYVAWRCLLIYSQYKYP